MFKKISVIFLVIIAFSAIIASAKENKTYDTVIQKTSFIEPSSNFFSHVETKDKVDNPEIPISYKKIAENDDLELYVYEKYLAIAVKVKETGYVWFSQYPNYSDHNYTKSIKDTIRSGLGIVYYNSITKAESTKNIASEKAELSYEYQNNGFLAHINFDNIGISFDFNVYLEGKNLRYNIPNNSIEEIQIEKKAYKIPLENKLKSIIVLPYFGSENYEINGYSFIPDGPGALIRYTDVPNSTGYIKPVYGPDYGIVNKISLDDNLKESPKLSLPIFGVAHGYNQNAFLFQVEQGAAYAELHAYPYGYEAKLNTTYMQYNLRNKYSLALQLEDASSTIITKNLMKTDINGKYTFLTNDDANYIGMAKTYRNDLDLKEQEVKNNIPLRLDLIGLESKKGLLGKKYVPMTTYNDVVDIVKDLENTTDNMELVYKGWNDKGFYGHSPVSYDLSHKLGGKEDFNSMMEYLNKQNIDIKFYNDPVKTFDTSFNFDLVKRLNLENFEFDANSPLYDTYSYINPVKGFERVNEDNDKGIYALALDTIGSESFTYKDKQNIYRHTMISQVVDGLDDLNKNYQIGLYTPNDYTFNYIDSYYNMPYESSRYSFFTDSVPFLPIVFKGKVNMYSDYINFVSDYNLLSLRLIEYGINPSFIITKEPTYLLKYTNSESIYTSEYALWENHINVIYNYINDALKYVVNAEISHYEYLQEGVVKVTYSNGVDIVINYTDAVYTYNSVDIPSQDYHVYKGAIS